MSFPIISADSHVMEPPNTPHSDSTWPDSQQPLAKHGQHLTPEQRERILGGNVADLYQLPVSA